MSLSTALNNATSGLTANSRLADTISTNVANALTEGFGRRTTELSSAALGGLGGGVRVIGTSRAEHAHLTAERRGADAALGAASVHSTAYARLTEKLGAPGDTAGLVGLATALETSLISLGGTPDSATGQAAAVEAAKALAAGLAGIAAENDRLRTEAEVEIARQVDQLNRSLHAVDDLNSRIATIRNQSGDSTALEDERARLVDQISVIVPVTTVRRDNGEISIYAASGGVLLKGEVYELSFQPHNGGVTAGMVLGLPLGALMQDQGAAAGPVAVAAGTGRGPLDGGSLGALFELRDRVVPGYNAEIDALAADMIERFRDLMPAGFLDGAGQGLFVDPASGPVTGLAGRIAVNAAVDPEQGGAVWRIRDGLSAATPAPFGVAYGDNLGALSAAMTASRTPTGFATLSRADGAAGFAGSIASWMAGEADRADQSRAHMTALQATLAESEIDRVGVNTDAELEMLMVVEQAYAANAQVLAAIDAMMQRILEI
jgi:flagellar hook-associated protein 1